MNLGGEFVVDGWTFEDTPDADIDDASWVVAAFDLARREWNDVGADVTTSVAKQLSVTRRSGHAAR